MRNIFIYLRNKVKQTFEDTPKFGEDWLMFIEDIYKLAIIVKNRI